MTSPSDPTPVIFFDGVCGLCNKFVDWVMRRDRNKIFRFAPLQGVTAGARFAQLPPSEENWSVIYVDENGSYLRSTAALKILVRLGGCHKLWGAFLIVPTFIRDAVYRFIAKRRY